MIGTNAIFLLAVGLGALVCIGIVIQMEKKKDPTLQQWVNRLIEHIDQIYIQEAVSRFSELVESGMEPAHAFEIVVRT